MTETEFKPFVPGSGTDHVVLPPTPVHEKKARKKRTPPAADKPKAEKIPPNIFKKKRKNPPSAGKPRVTTYAVRKGKVIGKFRKPDLDLTTMFEISNLLKVDDFATFSGLVETLQGVPKAARARILAAVGRVFA